MMAALLNDDNTSVSPVSRKSCLFTGNNASLLSFENERIVNEFYGNENQLWKLIYKGSRDGFLSTDFHRYCDQKGPTLTIISTKDGAYLFGGYTSVPWSTSIGYKYDPTAFLFILKTPTTNIAKKYSVIEHIIQIDHAVLHRKDYGPCFGKGDLYISSDCSRNRSSYIHIGQSYMTTESANVKHFNVEEIEVYALL